MAFRYHLYLLTLLYSCIGNDIKNRPQNVADSEMKSFYDLSAVTLEGEVINFSKYKGKKVLIVNTASKCGYTPQYADLQTLHEKHGDKVVILGFPSNDFGNQEPLEGKNIGAFCKKNYGIDFQMFDKVTVRGSEKHPVYKWLSEPGQNGWNTQEPTWNFCKYMIGEDGKLLHYYTSNVNPMSPEILKDLGVN